MPRLRMFAGPNGSGKSELIEELQKSEIPLGPVVNADNILKELAETGYIDLESFTLRNISQSNWNNALVNIEEIKSRIEKAGVAPEVKNIREYIGFWFSQFRFLCCRYNCRFYTPLTN